MYDEKRQHPRKIFTVAVTLDFGSETLRGFECRNISRGGMYVAIGEEVPIGKEGVVALTTKCDSDFITFKASFKVVCVYSYGSAPHEKGVGVMFTGMDEESNRNLQQILTYA